MLLFVAFEEQLSGEEVKFLSYSSLNQIFIKKKIHYASIGFMIQLWHAKF